MANISPILEIQGLEASINDTPVIKGLNLTVNPGEIHAIMGKNGSGKVPFQKLSQVIPLTELLQGVFFLMENPFLRQNQKKDRKKGYF